MQIGSQFNKLETYIINSAKLSTCHSGITLKFEGTNPFYVKSAILRFETESGIRFEKALFEPIVFAEITGANKVVSKIPDCDFDVFLSQYTNDILRISSADLRTPENSKIFLAAIRYFYDLTKKRTSFF